MTYGPLTLSHTPSGLSLVSTARSYRTIGGFLTFFGALTCGAVAAAVMILGDLYVVLALLGGLALVVGPVFLVLAGPLSARRRVDFDTVWVLHAAAEPRGSEILHAMADEIASVTGIARA